MPAYQGSFTYAYDFEVLPVGTGVVGCSTDKIIDHRDMSGMTQNRMAVELFVSCENGAIRYRLDGGSPQSTSGHVMEPGDSFVIDGYDNIANFRATRRDGVDGLLFMTYFRNS